jgi:hypothetical protein
MPLEDKDRQILELLQAGARLPLKSLAAKVGACSLHHLRSALAAGGQRNHPRGTMPTLPMAD